MATTHNTQIGGAAANTLPEIETASLAVRARLMAEDVGDTAGVYGGARGVFALKNVSINTNNTGGSAWSGGYFFGLVNSIKDVITRIHSITVHLGAGSVIPAAGIVTFTMTFAKDIFALSTGDTGGNGAVTGFTPVRLTDDFTGMTAGSYVSPNNKRYCLMEYGTLGGPLTPGLLLTQSAGNGVVDSNPMAAVTVSIPAAAGRTALPPYRLWDTTWGDCHLELGCNEGFYLGLTCPNFGTSATTPIVVYVVASEMPAELVNQGT